MKRVLLSAAHTLDAPGQVKGDLKEAELTRKILKFCIPYLEKKQIEFKTVPLDMNLLDRIDWINKTGYSESEGDVFSLKYILMTVEKLVWKRGIVVIQGLKINLKLWLNFY
ncbi:MAG: hypothetical protein KatS3mg085_247 [Candidatus Dojkabacteria bacterium]|nr:MAG: hypothetical protein KatS3mg085_247 [Candidatus Dojkabacteria bacterium]